MSNWLVAIPSYKRVQRLADATLQTLARGKVEPARITVFVADEEEAQAYAAGIPRELYGQIVVTKRGIANSRNLIAQHYAAGQEVVSFDDDVREVLRLDESGKKLVPLVGFPEWFGQAFAMARRAGARLWGCYPVCNAFFMKPGFTTDLRQIIGVVHGFVNDHRLPPVSCEGKEDIERTLQHYCRDGAVLRFNNIAPKQRSWDEPGGLQTPGGRTPEVSKASAAKLCSLYKGLCFMAPEMHGHAQVKLKDTIGLGKKLLRLKAKH